ncbi:hypothetical protein HHI36_012504 [Cryptolaemus montrouzieri]|uniref:Cytochrome P450 n=1 Tax=Cryptolaemus montrouzieri TaxID=559131 RepID=A0ABD2NFW4_9CUCU
MYNTEDIKDEINMFTFAGHDTTSATLSFSLLCLANYREFQDRIYEEMTQIVDSNGIPTYDDLMNMSFLDRFIKESLRLYPAGLLLSRTMVNDTVTKTGYMIPAGTPMVFNIFDIHRNAKLYPDPLKFDPDRFLPETAENRPPGAFIPFGYGPRQCIAYKYALIQMKLTICRLLKEFELKPGDLIENIEILPDLILKCKGGINIKFVQRF